jgi:hypothetical protein
MKKGSGAFIFKESVQEEVLKSSVLGLFTLADRDIYDHSRCQEPLTH